MIPWEEAYETTIAAAHTLNSEPISLTKSLGRVLAEDVVADMDMPPFDKAMVDGYACRRADLAGSLEVIETVAAGHVPEKTIGPAQCSKIMTGAMVPEGVDCVFMVEGSEATGDRVRFTGDKTGDNIARRAQDMQQGGVLLASGHRIAPASIAVLATMGYAEPKVARKPRVIVMATGDELVEPSVTPSLSQIRNSNGYQLCAQLEAISVDATYGGIIPDNEEALDRAIADALAAYDVVIFSGGVSMGDFDLVPGMLKKHGVSILFDKVAVQPGKPTVFGRSEKAYCFGLPGNPVATFVIFELLVKPFLFRMMGHDYVPPVIHMPLESNVTRKVGVRKAWVPVIMTSEGNVRRLDYKGSAHINAMSGADGLMPFPVGVTEIESGTIVPVHVLGL